MYLYLTTTGRVTGQPRKIEIWFTEHGAHFYLVAERKSANWVRNIQSQPQVKVRVGDADSTPSRAWCTMTACLSSRPL